MTAVLVTIPVLCGYSYFERDLTYFDGGLICELRHRLAAGDGFGLAAALGNGQPLLADPQSGLFYPVRWLQVLVPLRWAVSLGPIIHLTIAAVGAAWLARTYRARPFASACAGLAFAFCGTALNLIEHGCYVVGAAWLPVAWAAGRTCFLEGVPTRSLILLITSLTACLVGGEPQSFGVAVVAVAGEGVVQAVRGRGKRRWAGLVVVAALAALALSAPTWLPAAGELALGPRLAGNLALSEGPAWAYLPIEWVATLLPGVLTAPLTHGGTLWLVARPPGATDPWNPTPYLGPVVVVLALAGASNRRVRWPSLLAMAGVIAALGTQTPVLSLALRLFPPLRMFRGPEKYFLVVSLAAVVIAAAGIQPGRRWTRRVLVAGGAMAALGVIALIGVEAKASALDAAGEAFAAYKRAQPLSQVLLTQGARAVGLALATLGALHFARRRRVVLPALMVADILLAAPSAVAVETSVLDWTSPLVALRDAVSSGPVLCLRPDEETDAIQVDEVGGPWSQLLANRVLAAPNLNACDDLTFGNTYSSLQTGMQQWLELGLDRGFTSAARALGCTHFITTASGVRGAASEVAVKGIDAVVTSHGRAQVLALGDPVPEAFVARSPRLETSELDLKKGIMTSRSGAEAVREIDDPLHRLIGSSLPSGSDVGPIEVQWPRRGHAELRVGGSGGAVVGLRTSFWAGWRARQGTRELPVVRSGGDLLAAVVDDVSAGPVTFDYRPPHWDLALALAAAGLLTCLLALGAATWVR